MNRMEPLKYKKILVALDNSDYANFAVDATTSLAASTGAEVSGCHVYAARLHEDRFVDMESGLPEQYQEPAELERQRDIHAGLIEKGLAIIADSYTDKLAVLATERGVATRVRNREGKNWVELLKEVGEEEYDLVAMGGIGKGVVELSTIGGVAERIARGIDKDLLIMKTEKLDGPIVVGIDGSPSSFGALKTALSLSKVFGGEVEAVAVFDPYFHQVAFRNIAGALSEEAAQIFRFEEQEKLHDEIIDDGLAKLYKAHLDTAEKVARDWGVEIKTSLIAGKAFNEMLKHVQSRAASFLVLGRFGLHKVSGSGLGTTAENVVRSATTNVLITNEEITVESAADAETGIPLTWTDSALKRMDKVPAFVRGMATKAIEDHAREKGVSEVTEDIVDEVKKRVGM